MARDWRLRHLIETVADHSYGTAGSTHGGVRHREVVRLHVPDSHPERVDAMPIDGRAIRQVFMWLYGAPLTDDNVRGVVCSLWRPYPSTAVRYMYRALSS